MPTKTLDTSEIAPGVYCLALRGVNVYLVQSGSSFVLIDTGWRDSAPLIRTATESLFGQGSHPDAILLTHPHADHVGSAVELGRGWDAPVYAHSRDLPLLSGDVLSQPEPPEPLGRFMVRLARRLPWSVLEKLATPELAATARALPGGEGGVPGLADWECIPTPGHSPGHVAFFRRDDRVLIVGDALLTVPMLGLVPGLKRISRPPRLPSWDWQAAKDSVAILASLEPAVLASGHGIPMSGPGVAAALRDFSARFSGSGMSRRGPGEGVGGYNRSDAR
jgi:glyoxylase-like metal-dependent hydrolase (beta-lactamase superfamily II)